MEIVLLFFGGIMGVIIGRDFRAALISETYKVQKYSKDLTEYYKSEKAWKDDKVHTISTDSVSVSSSDEGSDRPSERKQHDFRSNTFD